MTVLVPCNFCFLCHHKDFASKILSYLTASCMFKLRSGKSKCFQAVKQGSVTELKDLFKKSTKMKEVIW